RILLELVPRSRVAVGVEWLGGSFKIGVVDLSGRVLAVGTYDFETKPEYEFDDMADKLHTWIEAMLDEIDVERERLVGIGVGVAGLVADESASEAYPTYLKSVHLSIKGALASRFDAPVFVDNNVKAMALGEQWFGVGRQYENLAFVK